jgi:uncharacterized protein
MNAKALILPAMVSGRGSSSEPRRKLMSPRANSEGDICLTCGLCCSGGLFDHLDLQPVEIDPIVALGAKLYPGEPPRIAFPCALLCGKACTVYDNRPAKCRKYRCELLFHREDGSLSDAEALRLIAQALDLVTAVETLLPAGQTVPEARRALQTDPEFWRKELGADQAHALKLVMAMAALNLHLDRHFRSEDQRLIRPD